MNTCIWYSLLDGEWFLLYRCGDNGRPAIVKTWSHLNTTKNHLIIYL